MLVLYCFIIHLHTSFIWNAKNSRQTCTLHLTNDKSFLFKGQLFLSYCISNYNIYVRFVEIKYAERDHTLQTVNTEFETLVMFMFSKIITNTCFHHVYNINTSKTTWKHCHVYRVNRGCPRGHKRPDAERTWCVKTCCWVAIILSIRAKEILYILFPHTHRERPNRYWWQPPISHEVP